MDYLVSFFSDEQSTAILTHEFIMLGLDKLSLNKLQLKTSLCVCGGKTQHLGCLTGVWKWNQASLPLSSLGWMSIYQRCDFLFFFMRFARYLIALLERFHGIWLSWPPDVSPPGHYVLFRIISCMLQRLGCESLGGAFNSFFQLPHSRPACCPVLAWLILPNSERKAIQTQLDLVIAVMIYV